MTKMGSSSGLLLEIGIPELFKLWKAAHGEDLVQETRFGERDPKSAGHYVAELDRPPYELQEELVTEDYGTLEVGRRVITGEYLFLVFKPDDPRRWYHKRATPCKVTAPTDLVVHAGFSMERASMERAPARGSKAAQGLALGAVVLAEEDHQEALQELAVRAAEAEAAA